MAEESTTPTPAAPTGETRAATSETTNGIYETAADTTRTSEPMTHDTRRSEQDRTSTDATRYDPTLQAVSHTNPHTNEPFGTTQTYGRGKFLAADGGEPDAPSEDDTETLEDVDHTPAEDDVDGAQGTFDRGREGPEDGTGR